MLTSYKTIYNSILRLAIARRKVVVKHMDKLADAIRDNVVSRRMLTPMQPGKRETRTKD